MTLIPTLFLIFSLSFTDEQLNASLQPSIKHIKSEQDRKYFYGSVSSFKNIYDILPNLNFSTLGLATNEKYPVLMVYYNEIDDFKEVYVNISDADEMKSINLDFHPDVIFAWRIFDEADRICNGYNYKCYQILESTTGHCLYIREDKYQQITGEQS